MKNLLKKLKNLIFPKKPEYDLFWYLVISFSCSCEEEIYIKKYNFYSELLDNLEEINQINVAELEKNHTKKPQEDWMCSQIFYGKNVEDDLNDNDLGKLRFKTEVKKYYLEVINDEC
jgi:hypothetical protein